MDTIVLKLNSEQAWNVDFLAEIPARLSNISQHDYGNGLVIAGKLGNMRVVVRETGIKIENSLAKYLLGNNIERMRLSDNKRAIEKLSDELNLPLHNGLITRFDYALNIEVREEVESYLPYLGDLGRYQRYESKRGLNYKTAPREIAIYDKIAEMKKRREPIAPYYIGKNMMRIEKRYLLNASKYFNRSEIKASDLYDEAFCLQVMDDWLNDYLRIKKLKNTLIDMRKTTTIKELYSIGVLALVQLQGGELAALSHVQERQRRGELTRKQAYDFKNAIRASSKLELVSKDNELIKELDEKVKEAVNYYR